MAPMTFVMQSLTPDAVARGFVDPTGLFVLLGAVALAGVAGVCAMIATRTLRNADSRRADESRPLRAVPRLAA